MIIGMNMNYKILSGLLAVLLVMFCFTFARGDNNRFGYGYKNDMQNNVMHHTNNSEGMMHMSMNSMINMLDGKTGKVLEKEFIIQMIPHHQGAIDMAKKLIADPSVSQELKDFANKIITAQDSEIKMMNQWLTKY